MCIRKGTSRIACFGNAIQADWRTTGVCTVQSLATTDQISLYLESGGSNDCIQVKMLVEELVWSVQNIFSGDQLAIQSHVCSSDPGTRLTRPQDEEAFLQSKLLEFAFKSINKTISDPLPNIWIETDIF